MGDAGDKLRWSLSVLSRAQDSRAEDLREANHFFISFQQRKDGWQTALKLLTDARALGESEKSTNLDPQTCAMLTSVIHNGLNSLNPSIASSSSLFSLNPDSIHSTLPRLREWMELFVKEHWIEFNAGRCPQMRHVVCKLASSMAILALHTGPKNTSLLVIGTLERGFNALRSSLPVESGSPSIDESSSLSVLSLWLSLQILGAFALELESQQCSDKVKSTVIRWLRDDSHSLSPLSQYQRMLERCLQIISEHKHAHLCRASLECLSHWTNTLSLRFLDFINEPRDEHSDSLPSLIKLLLSLIESLVSFTAVSTAESLSESRMFANQIIIGLCRRCDWSDRIDQKHASLLISFLSENSTILSTLQISHESAGSRQSIESRKSICRLLCGIGESLVEQITGAKDPISEAHCVQFVKMILLCTEHGTTSMVETTLDFWLAMQDVSVEQRSTAFGSKLFEKLLRSLVNVSADSSGRDTRFGSSGVVDLYEHWRLQSVSQELFESVYSLIPRLYLTTLCQCLESRLKSAERDPCSLSSQSCLMTLDHCLFALRSVATTVESEICGVSMNSLDSLHESIFSWIALSVSRLLPLICKISKHESSDKEESSIMMQLIVSVSRGIIGFASAYSFWFCAPRRILAVWEQRLNDDQHSTKVLKIDVDVYRTVVKALLKDCLIVGFDQPMLLVDLSSLYRKVLTLVFSPPIRRVAYDDSEYDIIMKQPSILNAEDVLGLAKQLCNVFGTSEKCDRSCHFDESSLLQQTLIEMSNVDDCCGVVRSEPTAMDLVFGQQQACASLFGATVSALSMVFSCSKDDPSSSLDSKSIIASEVSLTGCIDILLQPFVEESTRVLSSITSIRTDSSSLTLKNFWHLTLSLKVIGRIVEGSSESSEILSHLQSRYLSGILDVCDACAKRVTPQLSRTAQRSDFTGRRKSLLMPKSLSEMPVCFILESVCSLMESIVMVFGSRVSTALGKVVELAQGLLVRTRSQSSGHVVRWVVDNLVGDRDYQDRVLKLLQNSMNVFLSKDVSISGDVTVESEAMQELLEAWRIAIEHDKSVVRNEVFLSGVLPSALRMCSMILSADDDADCDGDITGMSYNRDLQSCVLKCLIVLFERKNALRRVGDALKKGPLPILVELIVDGLCANFEACMVDDGARALAAMVEWDSLNAGRTLSECIVKRINSKFGNDELSRKVANSIDGCLSNKRRLQTMLCDLFQVFQRRRDVSVLLGSVGESGGESKTAKRPVILELD